MFEPRNVPLQYRSAEFGIGKQLVNVAVRRLLQGLPSVLIRKLQAKLPQASIRWEFVNLIESDPLRRVKLLAREGAPVRLTFDTDSVRLVAISQDVGQASEELDAKYEGAELTVAFNPEFLLEGLEVTSGDEVALETVDSLRPALVRSPESPDFLYLLMPVRVS